MVSPAYPLALMFTFTVPYDEGFTLTVDGKEEKIIKTDKCFVGCMLSEGHHNICLKYTAPLAKEGRMISVFGIFLFIVFVVFTNIRKNAFVAKG